MNKIFEDTSDGMDFHREVATAEEVKTNIESQLLRKDHFSTPEVVRMLQLMERVFEEKLENRLDERFGKETQTTKILKIRKRDYEEAKKEVLDLINDNPEGLDSSEIMEKLQMDPELVLEIISELREEDKVDTEKAERGD